MEEIRTSEQSKTLYQSLRDGDVLEVVKAYAKATTLDARLKLIPTVHDDTILHMAIYMRQESIAMTIIEISSRDNDELITKRNQFGNTALHEAAATDFVRVVEKLLEKAPALLSIPNEKGEMPLYTAAHFGQKRIFILLAEKLKNNHCDLRPHFSSLSPSYKSVEELDELSYGPEHIRSTILHAAIHAEFFELALLIARKPEYAKIVQLRDKNKKTPLQLLSSNSSAFESGMKCGLIKWLIYKCAPYEDVKEEDAHEQNSSDESHVQSSKRSVTLFLRRVFSSVNRLVWIVLRAWSTMKNIYDERKRHVLALELRTSESCSTVAGLMATVAFTAAFTVPGGNDENSGAPLLLHSPFFLVFIITDALSLASSLTSLVMFLSILTSPFELHDFRHSLPQKLILGFTFLFFSVAVTMLAFASTLMLTIPMKKRVTKSFVYCVAFLPVTMFALLQFPLLLAFKNSLNYSVMAMKSVWFRISAPKSKTAKTQ
ncbi:ankyrin repeat-containing protein NPR4-like [Rosa rugosa]|uniref:ankyrin repeat-containing protein NPR4-like n=1 Tax=Rosa rugosa TaxID=74645 RepID=UPI002B400728|nr:ankyrin repeat-containing protein NPR4-like [Rosa rugosa]